MCAFLAPFVGSSRPALRHTRGFSGTTCSANGRGKPSPPRPFASVVASGALQLLIEAVLTRVRGLRVSVDASSNLALLGGDIAGIDVAVDDLELHRVSVTGGARLSVGRLRLGRPQTLLAPPRLEEPVAVSVSATLTEADLNRDGPVRDGLNTILQTMLNAALSGAAGRHLPPGMGPDCRLDYIRLDDAPAFFANDSPARALLGGTSRRKASGRLVLESHVVLEGGRRVNFAVRGRLVAGEEGTVVKMDRPQLLWRRIAFPIVTVESVGVQLMPLTTVSRLEIFDQQLAVDGVVIVRPGESEKVKRLRPMYRSDGERL